MAKRVVVKPKSGAAKSSGAQAAAPAPAAKPASPANTVVGASAGPKAVSPPARNTVATRAAPPANEVFSSPPSAFGAKETVAAKKSPKLELVELPGGDEHRQFPRARLDVRFSCWIGEEPDLKFSASLRSHNLSVSGAFLESSFFLPVGTELRVSFQLDEGGEPVQARAQITREERGDRSPEGRSGFAIRFVEFFGQTEVTLARLFLGEQLRAFAQTYLSSKRARSLNNELDRVVDALAAWELLKVTSPGDPWRPVEG